MSATTWEVEAHRRFPDLVVRYFDGVDSPGMLWIELRIAFEDAYQEPKNEDLISRIYSFAEWCSKLPDESGIEFHLPTIVATHFLEHIPELPAAREDMPRWFSRADVLRCRELFSYMVGAEGFQEILNVYDAHDKKTQGFRRAT
jgi:hypothetical protein